MGFSQRWRLGRQETICQGGKAITNRLTGKRKESRGRERGPWFCETLEIESREGLCSVKAP